MNTNTAAIDLNIVEVSYPNKDGNGRKVVLQDIKLQIKKNEFVTVIGESGSGKSTVLRTILGSQQPTIGNVKVAGLTVTHVNRRKGIVYQKYSLFSNLTVLDNIAFGPVLENTTLVDRLCHTPNFFRQRKKAREEALIYLKEIGLQYSDAKKHPHELSGGMQQRVAIAQSLIMKPDVLLMDEPFGALDPRTRADMQEFILEEWAKHKMTIFFVTHDLDEALFLGTRIVNFAKLEDEEEKPNRKTPSQILHDINLREKLPGDHPRPHNIKFTLPFADLKKELQSHSA